MGRRLLHPPARGQAVKGDYPECYWCGDTERGPKAASSRLMGKMMLTRHFCHDDERSCYEECAGNYFFIKYLGGVKR